MQEPYFNPQISQMTQIIMNVLGRLRNYTGLIPRSLQRLDRKYHKIIHVAKIADQTYLIERLKN